MGQICRRCKRTNPREAIYCYYDGFLLSTKVGGDIPADGSAINLGTRPFTVPCVLPSGKACSNVQQLVLACHQAPAVALDLLRRGHLESFFAGQGRTDLARVARAAAKTADDERSLDDFLGQLPFRLPPARLRVEPATLDLGTMHIGEDRQVELLLRNEGRRLLYGSAVCDAPWLSFAEGSAQPSKLFQFSDRTVLQVRVLGRNLRAFQQPLESVIRLESSGGNVTVGVRVEVPVQPFPEGVLAGARSPRELAKKTRDALKDAAALIEAGAVARWYQANGWTYPVLGPAASGVAAVQQLFEALGLVKTPEVELSEETIRLHGRPGERLEYSLGVITQENRAAIAHGTSNERWLQVGRTIFRGRSAFLPLLVSVPARPGETLTAVVSVVANGGQRFAIPVELTVAIPDPAVQAPAVAPVPSPPQPEAVQAASPGPVAPLPTPTPRSGFARPEAVQAASPEPVAPPPTAMPRSGLARPEAVQAASPEPVAPDAPLPVAAITSVPAAPPPSASAPVPPVRKKAWSWFRFWLTLLPALLPVAVAFGG